MSSSRQAVVVMGNHHSDTVAVAQYLSDLGLRLPSDVTDEPHLRPYRMQSATLNELGDESVKRVGDVAHSDWLRPDAEATGPDDLIPRARDALIYAFDDADHIVLPDIASSLIPFWEEVLRQTGYCVSFVHVHRHPYGYASDLTDAFRSDPYHREVRWLRDVLEAELATRHGRRAFVCLANRTGRWALEAERLQQDLGVTWPRIPQDYTGFDPFRVDASADETAYEREQRPAPAVYPSTVEALTILNAWARHGEDSAQREVLDRLRHRLDDASKAFAAVLSQDPDNPWPAPSTVQRTGEGSDATYVPDLSNELNALRTELTSARQALVEGGVERQNLVDDLKLVRQQRDRLQREGAYRLGEHMSHMLGPLAPPDAFAQPYSGQVSERRLRQLAEKLERENRALRASRSWRFTGPLRRVSSTFRRFKENW